MLTWLFTVGVWAAPGASLVDPTPSRSGPAVLVVQTPGFTVSAMQPLLDALQDRDWDPLLLTFDCSGQDLLAYSEAISEALSTLPEGTPVVAHGLGATAALKSGTAERYVLLAPVVALMPGALITELAERKVPEAVDLSKPSVWRGQSAVEVLLGKAELGCIPGAVLREAQGWAKGEPIPIDLSALDVPVWIGVSGLDNLSTSEATIPATRALPQRTLVRLGLGRLDHADLDHAQLLTDSVATRAAAASLGRPQ